MLLKYDKIMENIKKDEKKKIVAIATLVFLLFFIVCIIIRVTVKPTYISKEDDESYQKKLLELSKTEDDLIQKNNSMKENIYENANEDIKNWINEVMGNNNRDMKKYYENIKDLYTKEMLSELPTYNSNEKESPSDITPVTKKEINITNIFYKVDEENTNCIHVIAEYNFKVKRINNSDLVRDDIMRMEGDFQYDTASKKWQLSNMKSNNVYYKEFDHAIAIQ